MQQLDLLGVCEGLRQMQLVKDSAKTSAKSKVEYFESLYYRNNRLVGKQKLGRVLRCPEFEEG